LGHMIFVGRGAPGCVLVGEVGCFGCLREPDAAGRVPWRRPVSELGDARAVLALCAAW
jgi:hypothetical protein